MPHSDLSSHVTRAADVIVDVACQEIGDRIACASGRVVTRVCDVAAQVQDGVRGSRSLSEASLIVMGVRDSAGLTSDLLVSRIRSALPNVSIFVCSSRAERGELRIRHYARAGADEFFFIDSPPDITALVDHAMARVEAPPPDAVLWNLAPGKPTLADMIALWCLRAGYRRRTVDCVSGRFEIDARTANRHCSAGGFVSVSALLRSGRLYHAEELKRRTRVPAREIARRLGFSDAKALEVFRARARRAGLPAIRRTT